jgi:lipoprotein NlpD
MRKADAWLALGLVMVLFWGCQVKRQAPPAPRKPPPQHLAPGDEKVSGIYHVVGKGETLWRICKSYGADLQQVAEVNNIQDVTQIKVGQRIFIPGAVRPQRVEPFRPTPDVPHEPVPRLETFRGQFIWPVQGAVVSPFGVRNGIKHAGIDISAPLGSPVVAVADGEVIYQGDLRGYGNVLIIKHSETFTSVYAHLGEFKVKEHSKVHQGETVATVGDSGRSEGPHLHFEIRVNKEARNPLFYLPETSKSR